VTSSGNVLSGVTMGWLLRLVTGGPTGGRGPPVALFHETERNRAIIVVKCVTKMLDPIVMVF